MFHRCGFQKHVGLHVKGGLAVLIKADEMLTCDSLPKICLRICASQTPAISGQPSLPPPVPSGSLFSLPCSQRPIHYLPVVSSSLHYPYFACRSARRLFSYLWVCAHPSNGLLYPPPYLSTPLAHQRPPTFFYLCLPRPCLWPFPSLVLSLLFDCRPYYH
ncbi:hypothetical protein O6H91_10G037600 [Diphasiastrum complanatum]|uniref:Uncharacterized protein n=1 Tax=Diphasiastrum complanatum TaxID=34168 RepID=A0ACC2CG28_DIPCM|nr:hypothetical protein O6H91_10G037600 [Diphasiastrum complanatum]